MSFFRWQGSDLILQVNVQPRARQDKIVGVHDNRLKIRIKAPPVDGKANRYLCQYLARLCKLPIRHIDVVSGALNAHKTIIIRDAKQLSEPQLGTLFVQFL